MHCVLTLGSRQSRSRQKVKFLDRETVLKINHHPRRHRSCFEFQWPPTNDSRSHVNTNTQHFDNNMITKKQVAEIRDFFDNYEEKTSQLWSGMSFYERHEILSDNITSSKSAENLKSDQQRNGDGIAKMYYEHDFRKNQSILSSSTPNLSNSLTTSTNTRLMSMLGPPRKYFYLPEEKIHSNELVKIRQRFDKSYYKQNPTGISNTRDSVEVEAVDENEIGQTKNHNKQQSSAVKGNFPSSLNESYQKILQSTDSMVCDAMKINETLEGVVNYLPRLTRNPTKASALALIKSNDSILCGHSSLKCGGNEMDSKQQQGDCASASAPSLRQNHHRSRDLKPIKSLTTSERQDHRRQQQQEQQHNLILMNDDCKLLQVQDEQVSTTTSTGETCEDKYCKNSQARHDKNDSRINEISTTNSGINRKLNLNLDLFFDKELSAWISKRRQESKQHQQQEDCKTEITKIPIKLPADDSEELSNESFSSGTNEDCSKCHQYLSDSFSSTTSSTFANSEIDMSLIDTRRHDCSCKNTGNGIKRRTIFTDGEYIYGPYEFDLFSNEFYQFRDDNDDEWTNDDEAEKPHVITTELLKNHDEVDNNTEVSFVRDVRVEEKGCEFPQNNDRVDIEINVTNCSEDDESDFTSPTIRNDDFAFDSNFNYALSDACDRSMIDLMDEGDNYVSNNCLEDLSSPPLNEGDMQLSHPTILATTIYAKNFDAPFNLSLAELLNNSQQFNYERDKIFVIFVKEKNSLDSPSKIRCSGTCDDETFSNDERRRFIFGVDEQRSVVDTKNKIRFKERDETIRQIGSPQLHSTDTKFDELDNCFSTSKIDADAAGRPG